MSAIEDITAERKRQIESEGWTPEHDNTHMDGMMATAGATYALNAYGMAWASRPEGVPYTWPWGREWWKPSNPRRDLVKAAALIVAEIERLDRRSS